MRLKRLETDVECKIGDDKNNGSLVNYPQQPGRFDHRSIILAEVSSLDLRFFFSVSVTRGWKI